MEGRAESLEQGSFVWGIKSLREKKESRAEK